MKKKKIKKTANSTQTRQLSILAMPAVLYMLIFSYLPMVGLVMAFQNFQFNKGLFGSKWVGFENFKFLFLSTDFFRINRNSICYNIAFTIIGTSFCLLVAIMLNEIKNKWSVKIFQTSFLLPAVLSWVIVSYIVYGFLSTDYGILNVILKIFGVDPISWYQTKKAWPFIIVFVYVWKGFGQTSLIYYASILGIDTSIYEAARVDGAGKVQQIFKITLPLLKSTLVTLTLMSIGQMLSTDTGLFYIVTKNSGMLYETTDTINTYTLRSVQSLENLGMTSAAGLYQAVFGMTLVIISNKLVKKYEMSSGLF